ncbi:hypothetical protein K450DRAFT_238826 [Umbelopsis ramanniana AG]|uniref:Uncharacterized protein n=1 Tax=Umbelopsis ramanniana AG TaxID=1314678 RepID=A0AAD5HF29_UMBRA|nr:uncharacterized protein K450DRAFT_238826 [Umbelopsis ramanniana AG]KAI8580246.1 hypothetical protein K450DRAFT_238826 [Umbelopsis ramanniana AG]
MSTDLVSVSNIRFLASDLALSRGVAKDDVINLGDWSSDSVVEFYYRHSRLQKITMPAVILLKSPT